MAKTAKLKSKPSCNSPRSPPPFLKLLRTLTPAPPSTANPRSRASKRATSPSIDLDKSLRAAAPRSGTHSQALAARPGAGIAKKSKRGNVKTRGQKIRQERGLQRAEAVMDQMEKKVEEAREREGKRRERRKVWEEVNFGVSINGGVRQRGKERVSGSVRGEDWEDLEGESEDGDEEMGSVDGAEVPEAPQVEAVESTTPAEPAMVKGEKLEAGSQTLSLNGVEVEDEIT